MTTQDTRKVEKLADGTWHEVPFSELRKGDDFRLFEPDGEPVVDPDGKTIWRALSDPFINAKGQLAIETPDRFC